jgi:hypothetical protein
MRFNEVINEEITVILEKTTADELIPFLQPLGFEVKRETRNKVKVIVPASHRLSSVQQIAGTLPGSTIERDGKEVHYDGAIVSVKPAEAQGGRLEKETGQILALDTSIKEHLNGQPFIKLAVGTRIVNAAGVTKVPGNVKADAQVVNELGEPVAWISLKDGTTAKGFGHWGGIDHLTNDPEVAAFIQNIKATFGTEFPRGPTYGVKINNPRLKAVTCFGKEFGGAPGISNVDLILQGHPTLKKGSRGGYVITGAHTWHNGDIPEGEYEPVLMVRFASDRFNAGIRGARIASYPSAGRPWKPLPAPAKQAPVAKKPEVTPVQTPKQPETPASIQNRSRTMAQGKIPMGQEPQDQPTI